MNPLTKRPRKPEVLHAYRVEDAGHDKPPKKRDIDMVVFETIMGCLMVSLPLLSVLAVLVAIAVTIVEMGWFAACFWGGLALFIGIGYLKGRQVSRQIDAEIEAARRDPQRRKGGFP